MVTKLKLESYQTEALERALQFPGFALYFQQGTGKTATSIGYLQSRINEKGRPLAVLVVCPTTVVDTWVAELEKFALFGYKIVRLDDFSSRQGARFSGRLRSLKGRKHTIVVLAGYQAVVRRRKWFKRLHWDVAIADESQAIKKHTSKQSKAMWFIGKRSEYKLVMSGTPFDDSGLDVFGQYRFASPDVFGTNWQDFIDRYGRNTGYGYKKLIVRKGREDKLKTKIQSRMARVEIQDVIKMPRLIHKVRRFDMDSIARTTYDELEREAIAEFKGREIFTPVVVAKLTRLHQMTGGYFVDVDHQHHRICHAKARELKAVLKGIEGKVVIFCRFKDDLGVAYRISRNLGMNPLLMHGGIKKRDRLGIRQQFVADPAARAFVSQIRVGGIGVNELKVASQGVFYSSSYSWIEFDQAVTRLYRRGQNDDVTFYHLIARDTIDEDIYGTVKSKGKRNEVILRMKRRLG